MTEATTWPKEWLEAINGYWMIGDDGKISAAHNVLAALAAVGALRAPQENLRTDTCPPRHRDDAGTGVGSNSLPSVGQQAQPPKRIDTVLEKAQQVVYEYEVAMPSWNKGDYKYLFAKALVDGQQAQPAGEIDIEDIVVQVMDKPAYSSTMLTQAIMSAFDVRKKP